MSYPLGKHASHVLLAQRNHKIETLASDRADQPLTEGVSLWRPHRRLEDHESHRRNRAINTLRVNAIVIIHDGSMSSIAWYDHAELLRRPFSRRMVGHIPMADPSRADFQHHEDVEDVERGRDHHKEIAGQHGAGVIAHERAPRLRPRAILRRAAGR